MTPSSTLGTKVQELPPLTNSACASLAFANCCESGILPESIAPPGPSTCVRTVGSTPCYCKETAWERVFRPDKACRAYTSDVMRLDDDPCGVRGAAL